MLFRDVESGNHLALFGALAHQGGLAARAERQREGIEQDRFAGAGLAGQRGKAGAEIDIQPVDQNDVANGKARQHGGVGNLRSAHDPCRKPDPLFGVMLLGRRILPIPDAGVSYPSRALTRPILVKARLIQDPLFSVVGSPPAVFTRVYASLYQGLSGKLWPSTAAAVCASSMMPRET